MTGTIKPKETMFLREAVGEMTANDGRQYEATVCIGSLSPMLRSKTTGKWFLLSWEDIAELAIAAGIDEESKP